MPEIEIDMSEEEICFNLKNGIDKITEKMCSINKDLLERDEKIVFLKNKMSLIFNEEAII